jgi:carbonic anhydrase
VKKFLICSLLLWQVSAMAQDNMSQQKMTCQQGYQKLMDGNKRFMEDASLHPDRTSERRLELTTTQMPFACILGCADSRVAPDIIFDQGIGDLFVVRVAGNVAGATEVESVEYSVHHLGACIIMVLGHESCGAVKAVAAGQGAVIPNIAKLIDPALKDSTCQGNDKIECFIKANARANANVLRKDEKLAKLVRENKLMILAGYYNFHTGKVEILN